MARKDKIDSFTIEPRRREEWEEEVSGVSVYAWGTYGASSVLSGGTLKRFVDHADNEKEARKIIRDFKKEFAWENDRGFYVNKRAPIDVEKFETYKPNLDGIINALPGPEDPVPGGMYPDDWDD